jgi:hypothetical protein
MGHLDVPEVLIVLGIAAFVWLALHNWAIGHHHGDHVRHKSAIGSRAGHV